MPVHPATFPQFTVDMMSLRKYRLTGPSAGASAHLWGLAPNTRYDTPRRRWGRRSCSIRTRSLANLPSVIQRTRGPENQALGGRRGRARKPQRRGSPHKQRSTYSSRSTLSRLGNPEGLLAPEIVACCSSVMRYIKFHFTQFCSAALYGPRWTSASSRMHTTDRLRAPSTTSVGSSVVIDIELITQSSTRRSPAAHASSYYAFAVTLAHTLRAIQVL